MHRGEENVSAERDSSCAEAFFAPNQCFTAVLSASPVLLYGSCSLCSYQEGIPPPLPTVLKSMYNIYASSSGERSVTHKNSVTPEPNSWEYIRTNGMFVYDNSCVPCVIIFSTLVLLILRKTYVYCLTFSLGCSCESHCSFVRYKTCQRYGVACDLRHVVSRSLTHTRFLFLCIDASFLWKLK